MWPNCFPAVSPLVQLSDWSSRLSIFIAKKYLFRLKHLKSLKKRRMRRRKRSQKNSGKWRSRPCLHPVANQTAEIPAAKTWILIRFIFINNKKFPAFFNTFFFSVSMLAYDTRVWLFFSDLKMNEYEIIIMNRWEQS